MMKLLKFIEILDLKQERIEDYEQHGKKIVKKHML